MDYIRPTPRNPIYGLLADQLEKLYSPTQTQQMQGLMRLLSVPEVSKTLNLLSYGEPLTTGAGGIGGTTRIKPEVAEAALAVAPMAPAAGRAARGAARMAGQEIADVMSGMPSRSLLGDITPKPMQLITYHGTPHKFPPTQKNLLGEFDASKIGTGEGAQSFGYGIYVAENPSVAKDYQLMERNWFDTSKAKYKGKSIDSWYEQAQKDQEKAFRTNNKALEKDAGARLAYWGNIMTHSHPETVLKQFTDPEFGWDAATKFAKSIDLSKFDGIPNTGTLYKVDLPDEKIANMLDWDKPMAEQRNLIEKMRTALVGGDSPLSRVRQFELNDFLNDKVRMRNLSPQAIIDLKDPKIVKRLSDAGIPGIKYLDQFSRETGQGTRNFVVFPGEEKSLKILERDGEKAPFQFPQQGALDTAQKNAALPISEGGLGLPPNNTPMDRAKAMGFDVPAYHGTQSDVQMFDLNKNITARDIYSSPNPLEASNYATNDGGNVMPLLLRGGVKDLTKESQYVDNQLKKAYNAQVSKYEREYYPFEQFKDSFMRGQLYQDTGGQSAQNALVGELIGTKKSTLKIPDAVSGGDIGQSYVVQNPTNIRSQFAAFDPMRRNESDILAGLLPASLLADPETRRKLDEELSLLYTK